MILHGNNLDPAMRYEGLYRYAFDNCRKQEDPWEEATQSNYSIFMENDLSSGKMSLSRILHKLIFDNFKENENIKSKLIIVEGKIQQISSQKDAISIIDETISIVN